MSGADALVAALLDKTPGATIRETASASWCSATFAGERHIVVLSFADPTAATRFCDGLGEYEFRLSSGFVADIHADTPVAHPDRVHVRVEALTIEA